MGYSSMLPTKGLPLFRSPAGQKMCCGSVPMIPACCSTACCGQWLVYWSARSSCFSQSVLALWLSELKLFRSGSSPKNHLRPNYFYAHGNFHLASETHLLMAPAFRKAMECWGILYVELKTQDVWWVMASPGKSRLLEIIEDNLIFVVYLWLCLLRP